MLISYSRRKKITEIYRNLESDEKCIKTTFYVKIKTLIDQIDEH